MEITDSNRAVKILLLHKNVPFKNFNINTNKETVHLHKLTPEILHKIKVFTISNTRTGTRLQQVTYLEKPRTDQKITARK